MATFRFTRFRGQATAKGTPTAAAVVGYVTQPAAGITGGAGVASVAALAWTAAPPTGGGGGAGTAAAAPQISFTVAAPGGSAGGAGTPNAAALTLTVFPPAGSTGQAGTAGFAAISFTVAAPSGVAGQTGTADTAAVGFAAFPPTGAGSGPPGAGVAARFEVSTSRWRYRAAQSLFRYQLEVPMPVRADSVEYVYGTWTGAVPLDFPPPLCGFASSADADPDVMLPAQWVSPVGTSRTAALLVGPGTDAGALPRRRWWVIGELPAGAETVRSCGGYIDVV